jgi:endonuclease YncB( thermonuclease family)
MLRLLLTVLAAALFLPAAADAAWSAPCGAGAPGGPECTWWNAKVTFVEDGDTVRAQVHGVGVRDIRFTGINAMELSVYSHRASRRRGDCHGVAATSLVERLVNRAHGRVRLAAQDPASASGHRIRRSVWVKSGGRYVDLGAQELTAGLALWLPNGVEYAHNREYATLAAQAIAARRNLYDPSSCGAGPDDDVPLTVAVNWDADGNDASNLNGEWVDVRNRGTRAVDLSGWFVRDSWLRRDPGRREPGHVFAPGTVLPAGETLRLHAGCGADSALERYWCQGGSVFENVTGAPRDLGDGAYLFDPDGDLRASFIYPCLVGCVDAAAGRVKLVAHPSRPESMAVVNTSDAPVDLSGHVLKYRNHGRPDQYVFAKVLDGVLAPGRRISWTPDGDRFADGGGVVELRTLDDILTDCVSWGADRC